MKDTDRVDITCIDCNINFDISYGQYRKNPNREFRCKDCRKKHHSEKMKQFQNSLSQEEKDKQSNRLKEARKSYYNNLSEEDKKLKIKNMVNAKQEKLKDPNYRKQYIDHRKKWFKNQSKEYQDWMKEQGSLYYINLSDKDKKRYANIRQQWFKNLSEEEKIEYGKARDNWDNKTEEQKEAFKNYYNNLSEEEKNVWDIKNSHRMKNYWDKLNDKEFERRTKKLRNEHIKWYSNLSDEEKELLGRRISLESQKYWNNMTLEERKRFSQKQKENWNKIPEYEKQRIATIQSIKSKEAWDELTQIEKDQRIKLLSNAFRSFWDNMTVDEFNKWNLKRSIGMGMSINMPKNTELIFKRFLKSNYIKFKYQWYNKIKHELFDEAFPFNPITGSDRISPYHQWDFIIHTNQKNILVDIDGSIHNVKDGNLVIDGIDRGKYIKFNDSQRPFQTDGYDAYIIECYNDILNDDIKVKNINTGEYMSYKQFMDLLLFNNLTNEEIREMLNL